MKPDASRHNPDPRYLRGLRVKAGLSRKADNPDTPKLCQKPAVKW